MLLTRLELALRRSNIAPLDLARTAGYARQHLLRVRLGLSEATLRFIVATTAAFRALAGRDVSEDELFERAGELLRSGRSRLSVLFKADLAMLDSLLGEEIVPGWEMKVSLSVPASETVVRHLLWFAADRIDSNPAEAAVLFRGAGSVAANLKNSPTELELALRAHAVKGRANALRHLGKYDEALKGLALAAKLFGAARYCTIETAETEYVRASILFKREEWDEALRAVRAARRRFLAASDNRGIAHADLLEAGIQFDQGDFENARTTWLRVRSVLAGLGDRDALARVWLNLGACEIRRGRPSEARHWLNRASAAFRKAQNAVELARARWSMATHIATFHSPSRGLRALQRVERSFTALGMFVDAACVGLETLERMVDQHAARDELTRRATEVANVFLRVGLRPSAAATLDHLRRIATNRNPLNVLRDARVVLREAETACGPVAAGTETRGAPDLRPGDTSAVRDGDPAG